MKKYFNKLKGELILYIFINFVSYFVYALIPYYTKILFEGKYIKSIIGYIVCLALFIITAYMCNITQSRYKLKFDKNLKEDYFNKVSSMSYEEFSQKKIGEYISFQVNDITEIGNDYLSPMMANVTQSIRILTYFVVISVALNIKVSLILIGVSILGVLLPKSLGSETAKKRNNYLKYQKKYYSKIEELFNGFKVINFRTRGNIQNKHDEILENVLNERYKYTKANSLMWALNGLGSESINLIIFLYLGYSTFKGTISTGFAVAAFQYSQSLMEPVQSILYNMNMINSCKGLVKSFVDFVSVKKVDSNKVKISSFENISLINVNKEFNKFSLKNVSVNIEKGKKYALIGLNGAGKSTLFNILSSYSQNYSGEITVDGKNIKKVDTSNLISTMNQDEFIFSENFNQNVTIFGSYQDTNNNIFKNDSEKLQSINNCKVLSGGEQKIIGLIRLINQDTPIILLDEPFSAIDESKKENLLNKLLSLDKTVIMITHDIGENLSRFDSILFMANGELLYNLPYDELKSKKLFKELENSIRL